MMQINSSKSEFGKWVHLEGVGILVWISFWSKSPGYLHLSSSVYHHEWFENLHSPLWDEVKLNVQGWTQHFPAINGVQCMGSAQSLSKGASFGDSGCSTSCCTVQSYFFCTTWLANVNVAMKIIFIVQIILLRMQWFVQEKQSNYVQPQYSLEITAFRNWEHLKCRFTFS